MLFRSVENVAYGADSIEVTALVDARVYGPLREYDIAPRKEKETWEEETDE